MFDRRNSGDYYDVYLTDLSGNIVASLTENKKRIGQRNNGNAVFHLSGEYIVFLSEEEHFGVQWKWLGDPGLRPFCNLWVTTRMGSRFWKLTNIQRRTLG